MPDQDFRYPLHYPIGWERTRFRKKSSFNPDGTRTFAQARDTLLRELRLLGASKVTLSTNIPLRQDGLPYSRYSQPTDPGVAVYFELNKKPMVLACDQWDKVIDNVWAISKHIEAMRGQQRWGVGSLEQAFRGYEALLPPPKEERPGEGWWSVLQVPSTATPQEVEAAFRRLAMYYHPDNKETGNQQMIALINQAIAEARQEFKQRGLVQ